MDQQMNEYTNTNKQNDKSNIIYNSIKQNEILKEIFNKIGIKLVPLNIEKIQEYLNKWRNRRCLWIEILDTFKEETIPILRKFLQKQRRYT